MRVATLPQSPTITTALLVSSTLVQIAASHALPRETKTIAVRELAVMPWPMAATPAPVPEPGEMLRRDFNTVCGYIGGDPNFPATCLAGSHCAVDVENKAIGCCPDGGPCTSGIFTGCVDVNSPPQTELDPYVYTCSGAQVCYLNHFDGGFFQYGCGSGSHLATTVATTAVSRSPLDFSRVTVSLTETPTILSTPTTIGSRRSTRSNTKTTSSSSSHGTKTTSGSDSSGTSTGTGTGTASSSTSTSTSEPSAPTSTGSSKTGPIVGGVIGGLAGLALLAGLIFYFLRRKRAAVPSQYITPTAEKYDDDSNRPYPPNAALLTEERGVQPYESELTPLDTRRPSEPAPQLGDIGLAVPLDPGYGRPSDEIPLTQGVAKQENPAPPEPEADAGPYNPRRRGDGDGTSFWSQTRSETRSRGRPWV